MPVYLGIKYSQPEIVVFVCSEESNGKVELFKKLLQDVEVRDLLLDPSDLAKIETATRECFEEYAEDEVSINISGGTKPWTYYFSHIFSEHANANLFYVDQNSVVQDFGSKEKHTLGISIDEQLSLSEFCLSAYKRFENYDERDFSVIEQIREIRKDGNLLRIFNELTEDMAKHPNQVKSIGKDCCSSLTWDKKEKSLTMESKMGECKFSSPNVRHLVLNAGWFEVMVAKMLLSWVRCKEIRMNCVFKSDAKGSTSNEIDIIVSIGSKLLFVECKTQILRPTDIDKFNSAVKKYGGNGSKAVFVTYEAMSEDIRKTCEKYGIIPFSLKSKNTNSPKPANSLHRVLECTIFKNNL